MLSILATLTVLVTQTITENAGVQKWCLVLRTFLSLLYLIFSSLLNKYIKEKHVLKIRHKLAKCGFIRESLVALGNRQEAVRNLMLAMTRAVGDGLTVSNFIQDFLLVFKYGGEGLLIFSPSRRLGIQGLIRDRNLFKTRWRPR